MSITKTFLTAVDIATNITKNRGDLPKNKWNYRDRLKSVQILLSRTQAGPGRKVKQAQAGRNFSLSRTSLVADLCIVISYNMITLLL